MGLAEFGLRSIFSNPAGRDACRYRERARARWPTLRFQIVAGLDSTSPQASGPVGLAGFGFRSMFSNPAGRDACRYSIERAGALPNHLFASISDARG